MRFIEILHSNERLGGEIGADQKTEAEINLILLRLKAKWRDLLPQRGIVAILSKWVQSEFFFHLSGLIGGFIKGRVGQREKLWKSFVGG